MSKRVCMCAFCFSGWGAGGGDVVWHLLSSLGATLFGSCFSHSLLLLCDCTESEGSVHLCRKDAYVFSVVCLVFLRV